MTDYHILLVEDDAVAAALMLRALTKADKKCNVEILGDGEQAIQYLAKKVAQPIRCLPALVVTDLNMPKKTGFDVISWIRSQPLLVELPIVVMSTSDARSDIDLAMRLGANAYFQKPFGIDELQEIARSLLGNMTNSKSNKLAKPRVLVVDDHIGNRMALESLLEREYSVDTANSGSSAIELASKYAYAVILLDVRMPIMDGFQTAALLRENPKVQDTAIIFTSAHDQSDAQVARGYEVGATDYLLSPIDTDMLKLKMRTYVRMYLRIEALRIHIDRLTNLLQSLQLEISRRPDEEALRGQIRELEKVVAEMRREMVPA